MLAHLGLVVGPSIVCPPHYVSRTSCVFDMVDNVCFVLWILSLGATRLDLKVVQGFKAIGWCYSIICCVSPRLCTLRMTVIPKCFDLSGISRCELAGHGANKLFSYSTLIHTYQAITKA